jgi:hypothetical protein
MKAYFALGRVRLSASSITLELVLSFLLQAQFSQKHDDALPFVSHIFLAIQNLNVRRKPNAQIKASIRISSTRNFQASD